LGSVNVIRGEKCPRDFWEKGFGGKREEKSIRSVGTKKELGFKEKRKAVGQEGN